MLLKKKTKVAELRQSGTIEERKTKVHAQRKFAQGSPSFSFIRDREKENGAVFTSTQSNPSVSIYNESTNDIMSDVCPKTEDFLEFLCFRNCPGFLPDSLNYFSDPITHNYPNGVPSSESNIPIGNITSKQENLNKVDTKQAESKVSISKPKLLKEALQLKKVSAISSKNISASRIHSSFRKTIVNSGIMTRLGRIKCCSDSASKTSRKQILKKKKVRKSSPLPKRVATRSQLRNVEIKCSSTSQDEDSDSDTSSSSDNKPFPVTLKQRKIAQKNSGSQSPKRKTSKFQMVKTKTQGRKNTEVLNIPVSKNTRQSATKFILVSSTHLPTRKDAKKPVKNESIQLQKKSSLLESKLSPVKEKSKTSYIKEKLKVSPIKEKSRASKKKMKTNISLTDENESPTKMTREATRKLKNQPVLTSPTRRPSRRTKEAATFFMTLIGQEEEFYSSELEDQNMVQYLKEDKLPSKKKIRVPSDRKPESHTSSPVRERGSNVEFPVGPAKRRATILQEAAKRFTESQSSSSDTSDEDNSSSSRSSSSSGEDVPVRSIRTRSFDPTQAAKSPLRIEEYRKTRAIIMKEKSLDCAETTSVKITKRLGPRKNSNSTTEKAEVSNRKRPVTNKRDVETPPLSYDLSSLIETPVFHPNEKEFNDPIEYLEKIRPECERFGICRIVPPASFKPECQVSDAMRFTANNQYIHRMFRRRGNNSRILEAIHRHLRELNIDYQPAPCIGGIEVDLPGLYDTVQDLGGPGHVLEKNLWAKVADNLKIPRGAQDRFSKLDAIYCKYLLPYATLSDEERRKLLQKVDSYQNQQSTDDEEDECIIKGNSMPLSTFYRIARNTLSIWFPNAISSATDTSVIDPAQMEASYWKLVTKRAAHVCVHSGNIDSGQSGYGFPCNKTSRHPWNLKVLTNNNGSILRSLGPVAGCTVPTLHVSMLFSSSCWYRDPHGLPWIDYLHTGADKIWYGVPALQEGVLKQAMNKLVPDLVKGNKSVWLSSDTVMIPPTMLADHKVSLSRTVQKSGQFIVVWPRAFTSSLSAGYSVSESVCFAPVDWLPIGDSCFKELRINNEPTVFSLQQLLWSIAHDNRSTVNVLKQVFPILKPGIDEEILLRSNLRDFGVLQWKRLPIASQSNQRSDGKKRRLPSTSDEGDMECDVCQASLFFSRAECHSKADSLVTWCLMHALQKIKDHPRVTQHVRVFFVQDEDELRETVQNLQDQIRTKSLRRTTPHKRSLTL